MSIYTYLKEDHKEVKALMARIASLGKERLEDKKILFNDLKQKLRLHAQAEEDVFYLHLKGFDTARHKRQLKNRKA